MTMAARRRESAPHAVAARHSARRSASPREPRRAAERATSCAAVRRERCARPSFVWNCLCQEAPKPAEAIMFGARWSGEAALG